MPSQCFFFPGVHYTFYDNSNPSICWVNNFSAVGTSIILNKNEPADDLSQPIRYLKYPPLAITVRPEKTSLGIVCKKNAVKDVPKDSIIVPRINNKKFSVLLPRRAQLYYDSLDLGSKVSVVRMGIPLQMGYAFTNFYAEVSSVLQPTPHPLLSPNLPP